MDKLGDRIEETRTTFRTRITTIQVRREGMESVDIFRGMWGWTRRDGRLARQRFR